MTDIEDLTPNADHATNVEPLSRHSAFRPKLVEVDNGSVSESSFPAPCQEIIDMLEKSLAQAKSGELRAVAVATVLADGLTGTGYKYDEKDQSFCLLGFALSGLHARFYVNTGHVRETDDEPPAA